MIYDPFSRVSRLLWRLEGIHLDAWHRESIDLWKTSCPVRSAANANGFLFFQFFILLIFIFIGEIAVGALIYLQEAPYQDVISRSVEATVKRKYHHNSTATTQTFDLIQEGVRRGLNLLSTRTE